MTGLWKLTLARLRRGYLPPGGAHIGGRGGLSGRLTRQSEGAAGASGDAEAAADAAISIEDYAIAVLGERLHLAAIEAGPATSAGVRV